MHMTDNEIVRSFLESADKRKQIGILSELNACTEGDIVEVLEQDGRVKNNMLHAWKVQQGMRKKREEREAQRKQNEAAMLQEALHKREMERNSVPPPCRKRRCTDAGSLSQTPGRLCCYVGHEPGNAAAGIRGRTDPAGNGVSSQYEQTNRRVMCIA